jgi:hypothetical protein
MARFRLVLLESTIEAEDWEDAYDSIILNPEAYIDVVPIDGVEEEEIDGRAYTTIPFDGRDQETTGGTFNLPESEVSSP